MTKGPFTSGQEVATELLAQLEEEAKETTSLGYSLDPGDSIWCGKDGSLDPSDWIYDELESPHPLTGLLNAIIDHYGRGANAEKRHSAALRNLVGGKPSKPGPRSRNNDVLLQIAEEWWKQYNIAHGEPVFTELVKASDAAMAFLGLPDHPTHSERLDNLRKAFNANKDRLLKTVTGRDSEEQRWRREREREAIKLIIGLLPERPGR